jgi:hypothetical protein
MDPTDTATPTPTDSASPTPTPTATVTETVTATPAPSMTCTSAEPCVVSPSDSMATPLWVGIALGLLLLAAVLVAQLRRP